MWDGWEVGGGMREEDFVWSKACGMGVEGGGEREKRRSIMM